MVDENTPLSARQKAFCEKYVELNNGQQAAIQAGYKEKTAIVQASRLLTKVNIKAYIKKLREKVQKANIASAQDVMEFLTKTMNGEIKDQFGLDASLSDRLKAANELAKRTVDLDNRLKGHADTKVEIVLNWEGEQEE